MLYCLNNNNKKKDKEKIILFQGNYMQCLEKDKDGWLPRKVPSDLVDNFAYLQLYLCRRVFNLPGNCELRHPGWPVLNWFSVIGRQVFPCKGNTRSISRYFSTFQYHEVIIKYSQKYILFSFGQFYIIINQLLINCKNQNYFFLNKYIIIYNNHLFIYM